MIKYTMLHNIPHLIGPKQLFFSAGGSGNVVEVQLYNNKKTTEILDRKVKEHHNNEFETWSIEK